MSTVARNADGMARGHLVRKKRERTVRWSDDGEMATIERGDFGDTQSFGGCDY